MALQITGKMIDGLQERQLDEEEVKSSVELAETLIEAIRMDRQNITSRIAAANYSED